MHASIGPSAAAAVLEDDDALTVYAATQGVLVLAPALANVLGVEPSKVRVVHVEGPGCYGHNGADDAALEAALCARRVPGRHVLSNGRGRTSTRASPTGRPCASTCKQPSDAEGRIVQLEPRRLQRHAHRTRDADGRSLRAGRGPAARDAVARHAAPVPDARGGASTATPRRLYPYRDAES